MWFTCSRPGKLKVGSISFNLCAHTNMYGCICMHIHTYSVKALHVVAEHDMCLPVWLCVMVVCLFVAVDLSCMYKLFSRGEGGLACMVKCMSGHLRETGMYNICSVDVDLSQVYTIINIRDLVCNFMCIILHAV